MSGYVIKSSTEHVCERGEERVSSLVEISCVYVCVRSLPVKYLGYVYVGWGGERVSSPIKVSKQMSDGGLAQICHVTLPHGLRELVQI